MALDPRCEVGRTAIGDLLEIVRDALLVVNLPRRLGTNLKETSQRRRTDSVVSAPIARQNSNLAAEMASENSNKVTIPSISITEAAPEPDRAFVQNRPEFDKLPVQHGPESAGPARCLATEFCLRVEHIAREDEYGDYWHTHEQPYAAPPSLSDASGVTSATSVLVRKKVSHYLVRISGYC